MPITLATLSSTVAALVLVLALVLIAGRGARSFGLFRGSVRPVHDRRLGLQETMALDRVRRLQIMRCDGREFVLLTGGANDLFVGWIGEPAPTQGGDQP